MNVTFACRGCERASRVEVDESGEFDCPLCGQHYLLPAEGHDGEGISACPVCGCEELFVRSSFPQRLGITIVVIGFVASSVAWYYHMRFVTMGILFATALLDVILYFTLGSMLQCYRCHAEYRGWAQLDQHAAFDLEIHERHRQQAARLAQTKER